MSHETQQHSFPSDVSFPERNLGPDNPMPSVVSLNDIKEQTAYHLLNDLRNAADLLGWEVVNRLIEEAKDDE